MNSNIIFFDCTPSLTDEEIPEYFTKNIQDLYDIVKLIKRLRPNVQINLDTTIFDLKISENIPFRNIPNELKHQVKEEIQAIKINLQKSPYSIDTEHKLDQFFGVEAHYSGIVYEALTWTYLLDSIAISFNKKSLPWNSHEINVEINEIESEPKPHILRHASTIEHVQFYQNWFSVFEEIPDINDFIANPSGFLSNITLLDEAKNNLKYLPNHYPAIYETLSKVNLDLIKSEGNNSPIVFSVKNAPGEFRNRSQLLSDLGYEGYEAHLFFTGGIAGRIHYKLNGKNMEIKYIGKKLGI